jgi:hypothetical protein
MADRRRPSPDESIDFPLPWSQEELAALREDIPRWLDELTEASPGARPLPPMSAADAKGLVLGMVNTAMERPLTADEAHLIGQAVAQFRMAVIGELLDAQEPLYALLESDFTRYAFENGRPVAGALGDREVEKVRTTVTIRFALQPRPVNRLFAWVARAADGREGIITYPGPDGQTLLVAANRGTLDTRGYARLAGELAARGGYRAALVEFARQKTHHVVDAGGGASGGKGGGAAAA